MSFNYPNQTYFKGIQNISLDLTKGAILGIVGKSGSGKTTLLKCLYGLEDLTSGEIILDDEKVLGPAYNIIPGHEEMKLVSQDFYVLENHTVKENIFDKLIGYTTEDKEKRADKLLKLLELNRIKDIRAKHLSSGQKQRVAIARSLAIIPKVLLLDEPFSNLDKLLNEKLFAFITKEVKRKNTSVILITHIPEEALKFADHIAVMDNGRILQRGSKWDVYYQPKNTKLAGLLGDFNLIPRSDLEKGSKHKGISRFFLRPDKIRIATAKANPDLQLLITQCSFNGKCFEILAETKSGNTVILYSGKKLEEGRSLAFTIDTTSLPL